MPHKRRKQRSPYVPLHQSKCTESEDDFLFMKDLLNRDSRSIGRFQHNNDPAFKYTPLMSAYSARHYKCMEFLLDHGADPTDIRQRKYTTMHFAILDQDAVACELLLKHGLDPNLNAYGCGSFLAWAVRKYEITKLLLQYGAETDNFNTTRCHAYYISNLSKALRRGYCDSAKELLLYDAITDYRTVLNIHPRSVSLNSFPHNAVVVSTKTKKSIDVQKRMLCMLREFGVDLNQRNKVGLTALELLHFHSAADPNAAEVAMFLQNMQTKPLSLRSLSRIAVKQILGRDLLKKLPLMREQNVLPNELIDFMYFPNI